MGLTPQQIQWLANFAELTEEEIERAASASPRTGPMLQVSGPQPDQIGLRLGQGQPDYWGQEPGTGMTVQEWNVQSARGLPQLDPAGNPVQGPRPDVATRVRIHSPDPTAPAGSNSAEEWTMNIQQRNGRMTDDGQWFDTRYERSAAGARIDVRPYELLPDGTVVESANGNPVVDPDIVQAVRTSNQNMGNSHIRLFPEDPPPPNSAPEGPPPPNSTPDQPPPAEPVSSKPAPSEPVPAEPVPVEPAAPAPVATKPAAPVEAAADAEAAAGGAEAGLGSAVKGGMLGAGIAAGIQVAQDWDKVKSGKMSVGDAAVDVGGKAAEVGGLTFGGTLAADALAGSAGGEAGAAAGLATSVASVASKGGVIGGVVAGGLALIDDVGKVKSGEMTAGTATVDVAAKTAVGVGAGMAGAAAGAEIGAIVGTAIPIPVVGTAIGFVAGAVVGGAVGYVGSKIMDTEIGKEVVHGAGKAVDAAIDGVETAGKFVAKEAGAAVDKVEEVASEAAHAVADGAGKAVDAVENAASSAWDKVTSIF